MKRAILALILAPFLITGIGAQEPEMPQPTDAHKILKMDEGSWTVKGTSYMPAESEFKGTEQVHMVGGFWAVSHFQGNLMGEDFQGSSTIGYDVDKKKYSGSWVDSMSGSPMHMVGTYDKEKKQMSFDTVGVDPIHGEWKGKIVVTYNDDGTRTFVMSAPNPESPNEWLKVMEMTYTRAKTADKKKDE